MARRTCWCGRCRLCRKRDYNQRKRAGLPLRSTWRKEAGVFGPRLLGSTLDPAARFGLARMILH